MKLMKSRSSGSGVRAGSSITPGVAIPLLLALFAGCAEEKSPTRPGLPEVPPCGRLLVITTDYSTGSLTVVDADSSFAAVADVASVHADAIARYQNGLLYVVNRFGGDNIQVIDPANGFQTVRQFSVGAGSNPRDISVVAVDQAYVSRGGSTSVLKIDPRDGGILSEISLSVFADGDGVPDMDRLFYREPYLYVAIQRIDFGGATYLPVPPSYLAIIDTRADTLVDADPAAAGVQGIVLQGQNPTAPMVWDESGAVLLVPESGVYGALDAGIEKVDLDAWMSVGFLVREEALGGDLIDFVLTNDGIGYATLSDHSFVTSLASFDASTGTRGEVILQSDGYELADLILMPCGTLVVSDRDYANPGLRIFDAANGKLREGVTQPIPTGLPPFELVLISD